MQAAGTQITVSTRYFALRLERLLTGSSGSVRTEARLDAQLAQWLEATANPKQGEPLRQAPVKGCKAIIAP